jgi:hypothetical protein
MANPVAYAYAIAKGQTETQAERFAKFFDKYRAAKGTRTVAEMWVLYNS